MLTFCPVKEKQKMDLKHILTWYLEAGVDECISEKAPNRLNEKTKPLVQSVQRVVSSKTTRTADTFVQQAIQAAKNAQNLSDLDNALKNFTACGLSKTAAHLLSGIGVPNPRVLCIIEAPRAKDDKTGALLQDESGQLLLKMLKAIDLDYTQETYVATLAPWRTPGDRPLSDTEMEQCLPFLKRRIELLNPDILILFGSVLSGALLGISSISKAREKAVDYTSEQMSHAIKAFTTFAPTFLLKSPAQKRKAWEDLQKIQQYLIGL